MCCRLLPCALVVHTAQCVAIVTHTRISAGVAQSARITTPEVHQLLMLWMGKQCDFRCGLPALGMQLHSLDANASIQQRGWRPCQAKLWRCGFDSGRTGLRILSGISRSSGCSSGCPNDTDLAPMSQRRSTAGVERAHACAWRRSGDSAAQKAEGYLRLARYASHR